MIDQGGGSFSAYLFSGTVPVKRLKSTKFKDKDGKYLTEDTVLKQLKDACGFDLVNGSDGVCSNLFLHLKFERAANGNVCVR